MSRLPSLKNVLKAIQETILRFPLETITAICGTVFAILLSEKHDDSQEKVYVKLIMCSSLCLVLFLSVSLFSVAAKKNNLFRFLTSILLGSLVVAFVFNFREKVTQLEFQQFFVLNIALHLLVSFSGFLPKVYNQEEFWEFNKQLFLRILTSVLYSGVFYCGLALAIVAVDELFNVQFYNNIYAHVFFVIAGIFNTLFFLNGVPDTNDEENPLILSYPKGLKNFTQYVLLPLISLYLVILICYETKIFITLSLPVGWVSYLVLAFAITGILSFLLVHPIADENGNLWMRTFNRWFYFLLIPLLGLLFWAILYRINLYGFTHERYYVLLLSVWLTAVVAYFLIQKHPKIKFIPISLFFAAIFSIVGPQSANSVSKYSQLSRFGDYMQNDNKKLTFEQEKDLSSIVSFLEENYGVEVMIPYTKNKLTVLLKKNKSPYDTDIMKALGYEYRSPYEQDDETKNSFNYYFYDNNEGMVENIHGYDMSFIISKTIPFNCKNCIVIENRNYSIKSSEKDYGIDLNINNDNVSLKIIDFIIKNDAFKQDNNYKKRITQTIESEKYSILLTYLNVSGRFKKEEKNIDHYQIKVMIKIKK